MFGLCCDCGRDYNIFFPSGRGKPDGRSSCNTCHAGRGGGSSLFFTVFYVLYKLFQSCITNTFSFFFSLVRMDGERRTVKQ